MNCVALKRQQIYENWWRSEHMVLHFGVEKLHQVSPILHKLHRPHPTQLRIPCDPLEQLTWISL